MLHLEVKHLLVDVDVAMDLGSPDQVADGFDVAAVSIHRHLRIVRFALSLSIALLPGKRGSAHNCFATARNSRPIRDLASPGPCFRLKHSDRHGGSRSGPVFGRSS